MATRQLTQLPASSAGLDSDLWHIRQGASDKSLTGLLLKDFIKANNQNHYVVSSVDNYTATASPETASPTLYFNGLMVIGTFNANTGAATINVVGLGVRGIKLNGLDPVAGELNGFTTLSYNSSSGWFDIVINNVYSQTEKDKLTGIESGATADQSAGDIKSAYESNADTNAFTDALQTKLTGIESGATADQSAGEILTLVKTVDGAGSGLDADLLDGQHGSYYQQKVKAWISFNGQTNAIYSSFNVSSLTDQGVGQYRINFASALASANSPWSGSARYVNVAMAALVGQASGDLQTTTYLEISTANSTQGGLSDYNRVNVIVFGD